MQKHVKIKHSEDLKSKKTVKCNKYDCKKEFFSRKICDAHIFYSHNGPIRYTCESCGKYHSNFDIVNEHIKDCNGITPGLEQILKPKIDILEVGNINEQMQLVSSDSRALYIVMRF